MFQKPRKDQTWGECLFEQMAETNGLNFCKISEGSEKSVDYEVTLNGISILFEISDFIDGSNEYGFKNRYLMDGQAISRTVGARMKKKVANKRKQVSEYVSLVQKPCILLVYSQDGFYDNGNDDIISSIIGNRTMWLSRKTGAVIDQGYDGRSIFKPERNTSFSAIGNIYTPTPDKVCSDIYINPWAKYPVPDDVFNETPTIHVEKLV